MTQCDAWTKEAKNLEVKESLRKTEMSLESILNPSPQSNLTIVGKLQAENIWKSTCQLERCMSFIRKKCLFEEREPVKYWLYDHIFCTEYNIGFHRPKKMFAHFATPLKK